MHSQSVQSGLSQLVGRFLNALSPIIDPIVRGIRSVAAKIANRFPKHRRSPVPVVIPESEYRAEDPDSIIVPNEAWVSFTG